MSFIQKNLNTKLFFLLLILLSGIATLTLIYELGFTELNTKYHTKLEELNDTFNELTKTKTIINKTKEELTLKSLREEDLSTQYVGLKEENEQRTTERDQLQKNKADLEQQLLDSQREGIAQKHEIEDKDQEISDLKESSRNKLDQIDSLQAEVDRLHAQGCA